MTPYESGRFASVSQLETAAVRSSEDLAALVQRLRKDLLSSGRQQWENGTLDTFLEALAAVLDDVELPTAPSWADVADVLVSATGYE